MKYRVQRKLPLQLALYTALVTLLLSAIITVISGYRLLGDLKEEQLTTRNSLIATTLPAFNLATFNFNNRLNQHLAEGLISHPEIASAIVLNTDGTQLAQASDASQCHLSATDQLLFPGADIRSEILEYAGTRLGKLVIELNPCLMADQFYQRIGSVGSYSLIVSAVIALFIYIAFYYRVTYPLTHFARQLADIDADHISDKDLHRMRSQRGDELGELMNTTTGLLDILKRHIEQRRRKEENIHEYSSKLETLIHKRTDALADINRRMSLSNGNQAAAFYVPLLSLLLPRISELLDSLKPSLDEEGCQLCNRLQSLLEQLSIIEKSEDQAVISLSELAESIQRQHPQLIRFRLGSPDKIILPPQRSTLLLNSLFSIAADSYRPGLEICARRRDDTLVITLSGDGFTLSCDNLNTMITEQLSPGPGMLAAIARSLGGQVEIRNESSGQVLECTLLVKWLEDELQPVRQQLLHTPVQIRIANDLLCQRVKRWLQEWDISFSDSTVDVTGVIILTDSPLPETRRATYLRLSADLPDRAYQPYDLLADLRQLIPQNQLSGQDRQAVLLVDDNTINRMLCQRYLKNLGISPDAVDNGLQALEKARSKHYDLILMDCQMPVMDGLEATRQIRRNSINRDTPIIALTGLSGENERQQCLTAGMNDYIGKPFTQDQIQACLVQWLDPAAAPRQPAIEE